MEREISNHLKIKKVREMKNPVIIINNKDFDNLKDKLESEIVNFKVGDYPRFQGIPIMPSIVVERGLVFVYDKPIEYF